MKHAYLKIFLLIIAALPGYIHSAEGEKIDKVIEYLKIAGYEELVKSGYEDCVNDWMEMAPDNKKLLVKVIAAIEAQRNLEPRSLVVDEAKFKVLIEKLNVQYIEYAQERCKISHQDDKLYIIAREYAKYVTSKDMDAILAFAKTPVGQKDIVAAKRGIADAFKIIGAARKARQKKSADDAYERTMEIMAKYFVVRKK